jgi:methionyl aminopeptidase
VIHRKSGAELELMARAGSVVARAHDELAAALRPGLSTLDLDVLAERVIRRLGATPSFKGYRGFPATLCTSPNQVVVHGIPSADVVLQEGGVLSIDCGAIVEGFHADAATTHVVGGSGLVGEEVRGLLDATRRALWSGIEAAAEGARLGDIGAAVQAVAEAGGYGSVRAYVGHGVGRALHEEPAVPNHGVPGRGLELERGLAIAIEPMFTLGGSAVRVLDDGWTVETGDGSLAAHEEHTIAVTRDGPWVLTAREHEPAWPQRDRGGDGGG